MKKLATLLVTLVLCLVAAAAMADVTVTDMTGREVTLSAPAKKVVAITASNAEIVCMLDGEDTLVGRGEYCNYPETILSLPVVKSGAELNVEEILMLEPDVVLMDIMSQTVEQTQALENAGVKVVCTKEAGIEGVYTAIELIGKVLGKDEAAKGAVKALKLDFEELKAQALKGDVTVYFEISPLEWGLWTAGNGTFMNEIAELLGMKNVFADVDGWASVSEEQVIERNPAVIVTTSAYYGAGPLPVEEIMGREAWQGVDAVVNGAVFNADSDEMTIPGPRLVDGARNLLEFVKNLTREEQPAA